MDVPSARWEGISAVELARCWGVPEVHAYARLGSTNDAARTLAREGAPAGAVVIADEQLAGRGRLGRAWKSSAGLGVWLSLIIRPTESSSLGVLPLVVGLAVAEALDRFLRPATARVKWPNDIVIDDRKVGGVLCEASWDGGAPEFVILGVGVNVLHTIDDFPAELTEIATSLRLAGVDGPDRLDTAAGIVTALRRIATSPELDSDTLAGLAGRDALRGREVAIVEPMTGALIARGTAVGIGPDGALMLRDPAGVVLPIRSGTARPISSPAPAFPHP